MPDDFRVLSPMNVPPSRLVIGDFYFVVAYLDDACVVPVIDSLVFIGRGLSGEADGSLYFQDADSYLAVGAYPNAPAECVKLTVVAEEPPPNLFALPGVLDELARCLERRAQTGLE